MFWRLLLGPNFGGSQWSAVGGCSAVRLSCRVEWGRNIRFRNIVGFGCDKALMVIGTGLITREYMKVLWLTKEWYLVHGPSKAYLGNCQWKFGGSLGSDSYRGGANSCDYSSFVGQSKAGEMNHRASDEAMENIVTIKWCCIRIGDKNESRIMFKPITHGDKWSAHHLVHVTNSTMAQTCPFYAESYHWQSLRNPRWLSRWRSLTIIDSRSSNIGDKESSAVCSVILQSSLINH